MEAEEVVCTGIITPADWDQEGNITAFNVSTYREEEYILEGDHFSNFSDLLHHPVQLTGILREMEKGKKVLCVRSFRFLR